LKLFIHLLFSSALNKFDTKNKMDTWLDSRYVAENYVRSIVTPTFAPAIASR
jgi:hypothetical protein